MKNYHKYKILIRRFIDYLRRGESLFVLNKIDIFMNNNFFKEIQSIISILRNP